MVDLSRPDDSEPLIDRVHGSDRDFSEDDHLADILFKLRPNCSDDFALEEFVWLHDGLGRKDISIKRMGVLVAIIEVKRPAKFNTPELEQKASDQVTKYARSEGCRNVAWTDGTTFVSRDLITEEEVRGDLFSFAHGIHGWEARQAPTFLRPQWTFGEYLEYPTRQRDLHVRLVPPEYFIERTLPNGPLSRILSSAATLHVIYGECDVGKSTLARAIADNDLWNAIYLEPILFASDIESAISSEIATLYGRSTPVQAFIERVHEVSVEQGGKPFGIVLDGFDEWTSMPGGHVGALQTLLQRAAQLKIKIVVFSRPTRRSQLSLPALRGFMAGEMAGELGEMNDAELDVTVGLWFRRKGIGGVLAGKAREICRNPGICWLVVETYEKQSHVDPDLTEPKLYDSYRERIADKLEGHGRLPKSSFNRAISRLAREMLEREHFAVPHDVAATCAGSADVLDLLIGEGVLQTAANHELAPIRFRHGQFRNHTIAALATAAGIPVSRLVRGIEAIQRSEGLE